MSLKLRFSSTLFLTLLSVCLSAQNGILKGKVTDALTNEGIAMASITLQGKPFGGTSNDDGTFEITEIPPGFYTVVASYLGYKSKSLGEVQITNSRPTILEFALEEESSELQELVIQASPFNKTEESPLSLRNIGTTEIQRNPGGNRDISRVVTSLPGVTTTASFRNDLLIRGGGPNENRFYLDDVEVPNINHFATQGASGGPVGMINVDFIREVNFFSGAFPANRGNTLSSVFNFTQRNGRDDRWGGTFTVGSSDIALSMEGPASKDKKTTVLLSARQSYLQFLFQALDLPFLPTYNDFQVKIRRQIDAKNEIYFTGLGAIDRFKLNLEANKTEYQRYLLNNLPVSPQWNYTNGLVYKHYNDNGFWTFVLSRNMLNNEAYKHINNDESLARKLDYRSREIENKLRIENTTRRGIFKLNTGIAYEQVRYSNSTRQLIATPAGTVPVNYSTDISFGKYALFGQASAKLLNNRLTTSLGLRFDGNTYSADMAKLWQTSSPRLSVSYAVNDRLALNFNTGVFYQLPAYTVLGYKDSTGTFVNKGRIKYTRAAHLVIGGEYTLPSNTKISVEGYFKQYSDYPFLLREQIALANLGADFGVIGNAPTASTAQGRTMGLEVLIQQRLYKGFYGILAYTLGKAEFQDAAGKYLPSSWDSRHIVNLVLGKQFKRNWEIGAKFRLQTGLPLTPYDQYASSLVSNWDAIGTGIRDFTRLNSQRGDVANQLDIRVDKKWYFKKWSLNLYLDIQNVYASTVGQVLLQQELDSNGNPVIVSGSSPARYQLKNVDDATGTRIPTVGIIVQL